MKSLTLAQIIYIQIILQKPLQGETVSPLIIKDSNRGYQKARELTVCILSEMCFINLEKVLTYSILLVRQPYKTMLFLQNCTSGKLSSRTQVQIQLYSIEYVQSIYSLIVRALYEYLCIPDLEYAFVNGLVHTFNAWWNHYFVKMYCS